MFHTVIWIFLLKSDLISYFINVAPGHSNISFQLYHHGVLAFYTCAEVPEEKLKNRTDKEASLCRKNGKDGASFF